MWPRRRWMARAVVRVVPSRTARLIYLTLWPLGAAFLLLGLLGDHRGVWSTHQFLLKLASAFTGFCFGAPIASSIMGELASRIEIEQKEQRRKLENARSNLIKDRLAHERQILARGERNSVWSGWRAKP